MRPSSNYRPTLCRIFRGESHQSTHRSTSENYFVLTKYREVEIIRRMKASDVELVQRCYPQIYLACHKQHVRARSTPHQLSSQDSSLLVHLSPTDPMTPGKLARHLGIGASTLSGAIRRLARLGYLRREASARDRRVGALTLTAKGAQAMAETSVLDRERVAQVLSQLSVADRKRALAGLELLANASRQAMLDSR